MGGRILKKKYVIIFIICIFLFTNISAIGFKVNTQVDNKSGLILLNKTIIVPDDYPTIQEAIDSANNGDTVFVKSGIYEENVIIKKNEIILKGENKDTTVIDGGIVNNIITVKADYFHISDFTLKNGNQSSIKLDESDNIVIENNKILPSSTYGINIENSNNITIENNIILDSRDIGIQTEFSRNCKISKNHIINENMGVGIALFDGGNIEIFNNSINKCSGGIKVDWILTGDNIIDYNQVINNTQGLIFQKIDNFTITYNQIESSSMGIDFYDSYRIYVIQNNFIYNIKNALFIDSNIYWDRNYWDKPRNFPYIIIGFNEFLIFFKIPRINIDWHPAKAPHIIN